MVPQVYVFSTCPCYNKGRFFIYFNDEGVKTVLNLTLEEVKAYQKDYTAVPVAKECLADMTTPLAFFSSCKKQQQRLFSAGKFGGR